MTEDQTIGVDPPLPQGQTAASLLPSRIGPYLITRLLGEGGMGRVYLAEESHPPRQVALKVMALDAASARFQREIELLAQLEHPGIARLYAAGEDNRDGHRLPWLAMEYVRGIDLLAHADREQLDTAARVALLIEVCRAVQYAHSRGVIHRDLKPGNVLVDPAGQPKVLDFGIARLRSDPAAPPDATMTLAGQVLGTLPWMSPEQLGGAARALDARSDVYALGVIGYELIGGRLPHPRLRTSSLFEALDIVRTETPPSLAALTSSARGDLGTVVMKALAADPSRRYASAAEFAADLQRVLEHRPIDARPPTALYLLGRIARRHRAFAAATLLALLALVGASVVSTRFAWSEAEARREAESRAQQAAAISGFLQQMLASADPENAQGREVTVSEVVDQAERDLSSLRDRPDVQQTVLATLAATRTSLGQFERALTLVDAALAAADRSAATAVEHFALLRQRASVLTDLGRFVEARAAVADARSLEARPDLWQQLRLQLTAARIEDEDGNVEPAEAGYRAVLEGAAAAGVPLSGATGGSPLSPGAERGAISELVETATSNLSAVLRDRGRLDEARELGLKLLEARVQRYGERDPRTLASRQKFALLLAAEGDHAAAEVEARNALQLQREVLGSVHASTLTTMQSLANILLAQQQLDEAEELTRASLAGMRNLLGDRHAQVWASMNTLAYLLEERGAVAEAEAQYRLILQLQDADGTRHPTSLAPHNNLAMLLLTAGKVELATREFEGLLRRTAETVGTTHPYYGIFQSNYGLALHRAGRHGDAASQFRAALEVLDATVGSDHERSTSARSRLADALRADGRLAEADALAPGATAPVDAGDGS